jgi:hypothetical protein
VPCPPELRVPLQLLDVIFGQVLGGSEQGPELTGSRHVLLGKEVEDRLAKVAGEPVKVFQARLVGRGLPAGDRVRGDANGLGELLLGYAALGVSRPEGTNTTADEVEELPGILFWDGCILSVL